MAFEREGTIARITEKVEDGVYLYPGNWTEDVSQTWRNISHINAYEIRQCYGGPEEGGWWYDMGTCLQSVSVNSNEDLLIALKMLADTYGDRYTDEPPRHRDGEDLTIYVEDEPGRHYPTERPHYE